MDQKFKKFQGFLRGAVKMRCPGRRHP